MALATSGLAGICSSAGGPQPCIMLRTLGLWLAGPPQHWPQLSRALHLAACPLHLGCGFAGLPQPRQQPSWAAYAAQLPESTNHWLQCQTNMKSIAV